ncbi:polysaccharide pyruvyl transferase CsaB [Cohnella herbarum]|uniref:Polysaccharide pyruvyl transferase CsaB n=1 Tax=Cohnella herbarum TaxID=2728023 RepID=A0A7Z2VM00_9BACL|nr:polysaccharide pyruvyl transferase CsaB [Cohnella herbarum]QJD85275.1 polysaccharide pyruvyl transferase CsaB [Cohnella herbarum]
MTGNAGKTYRLVLSGFYGFRNSGDEAVLKSILTALDEAADHAGIKLKPIVLSGDPEWTSKQYGVEAVHRMKLRDVRRALKNSDGLISGGGSLLQDATGLGSIPYYLGIMALARWCGKPTFVYAQGIGPVNRKMFEPFIARAFRKAAYVSVRDEESATLLRRYGVPPARIDVVPDPVMGLPAWAAAGEDVASPASGGGSYVESASAKRADLVEDTPPVVGVSVRFWRGDRADLDRAAAALEALAGRHRVRLRFLPFHRGADEDASRYVMERLGSAGASAELAPAHDDPQQMLREVGRCALLIGMRLHSLIYAANQNVPLLGLSYDPKIDQFLQRLGQRAVGTTEELDTEYMSQQAVEILRDPERWHQACDAAIARLKKEAGKPSKQIVSLIRK